MKYMGSKNRHAKDIIRHFIKNEYFVEPFVGGGNIIDKITGNRISSDINYYLIEMWKAVSRGWLPNNNYTEDDYYNTRDNKDKNPVLTGYMGFALSYGGKWFGGWRRDSQGKRDYVQEAYRNAIKQFPKLKGVEFYNCSYENLTIPKKSTIYCDPPYYGTTGYKEAFDHELFWDWCKYQANLGHDVYVSEYNAPDYAVCLWEKEVNNTLVKDTGSKKGIEKLFKVLPP